MTKRNKLTLSDVDDGEFFQLCDLITSLGGDPWIVINKELSEEGTIEELRSYSQSLWEKEHGWTYGKQK